MDNIRKERLTSTDESMKEVYLITSIEEYGKLVSFCIENDINVWRTYWDEREKNNRCYQIDWHESRCYYSSRKYYENKGYKITIPDFYLDKYGNYKIDKNRTEKALKGGAE